MIWVQNRIMHRFVSFSGNLKFFHYIYVSNFETAQTLSLVSLELAYIFYKETPTQNSELRTGQDTTRHISTSPSSTLKFRFKLPNTFKMIRIIHVRTQIVPMLCLNTIQEKPNCTSSICVVSNPDPTNDTSNTQTGSTIEFIHGGMYNVPDNTTDISDFVHSSPILLY